MESMKRPCTSTTAIMRDWEVGDEKEEGGKKRLHPQTNDRETSTKQIRDGNGQNVSWNYSYIFYVMKSIGCKSRARETAETDGVETSISAERECRGRKGNINMLLTLMMYEKDRRGIDGDKK